MYPTDFWFIKIENSLIESVGLKSRKVFINLFFSEPFSRSVMLTFDIRLIGKFEMKRFFKPRELIKDFFEKKTTFSNSRPLIEFT